MDDEDTVFEPTLNLPNGYSLLLGSLLEEIYFHADEPDTIRKLSETTYATLYMAQYDTNKMKEVVQEAIINEHMADIDEELKELLEEDK
jgi:hypothetical protein